MSDALLELKQISVKIAARTIIENVSLQLQRGEIITVIGPNGAGKSTLLRVALGLLAPTTGAVYKPSTARIGYMPQRLQIDVTLPLSTERFLRLGGSSRAKIGEALAEVAMTGSEQRPLQTLSGGELQRVLLARALLRDPDLLVLDEPVQGVDLGGQTAMYELIGSVRQRHRCAVLMVSHDLQWVMAQTDHVLCLNQHICCEGHPEQVGNDPAYRELFGLQVSNIAPYHHHHNHQHSLHGEVRSELNHDA
jgi:zinc transport system ATP-binding protein